MLPMNREITAEQKDTSRKEDIRNNKDNVLNYIVKRAIDAVKEVFDRKAPTIPEVSKAQLKETKLDNDTVLQWLTEEKDIVNGIINTGIRQNGVGATYQSLLDGFSSWAKYSNYQLIGKRKFIDRLKFALKDIETDFIIKSKNNKDYLIKKGGVEWQENKNKSIEDFSLDDLDLTI